MASSSKPSAHRPGGQECKAPPSFPARPRAQVLATAEKQAALKQAERLASMLEAKQEQCQQLQAGRGRLWPA